MKRWITVCCFILLTGMSFAGKQPDKTAWFEGKWGVFFHYLATPAGTTGHGTTAEAWNRQISKFDVEGLAEQLEEVGADYFVITLGQGSGLLLSHNKVYDELTGFEPPKSPERDLVSDLADALNRRGIKLMVYTAAELGWADLEMRDVLSMTSHHNDHRLSLRDENTPNDWQANRDGQIEYLKHWQNFHEHWSKQWGTKVAGWWVDGGYHADVRFPEDEPPNFKTMKDALLAGNPQAIVAFNGGKGVYVYSKHEDYTAGEISKNLPDCPGPWVEKDGHRDRYHVLTYLGEKWGRGSPRFTDDKAAAFAKSITSKGGFVSFDVPPQKNGLIPEAFIPQLKHIGKSAGNRAHSIIPQPVELKAPGGEWILKKEAVIAYADPAAKQPAELLAEQLRAATGFKLPVQPGGDGDIVFQTLEDASLGDEGYTLKAADSAVIAAPSPAGLFYGAQTLRQLLPPEIYSAEKVSRVWKTPTVEIRDFPRFGWRGLHLDTGRHFMPKEDVMKFIDTMAALKFNTFHWHLTEDQGWRIEIRKYPKLTEAGAWREETLIGNYGEYKKQKKPLKYDGTPHGGFYTQDDIREVVAYAAERHITIVPEIDMPGHMQAAIAAYPELGCTTNRVGVKCEWGISRNILNPEESTVQFCKDVLTEVMELFPSEFIHIGGDEAKKDQWEASARIQQLREERGLKDMHEMQSWFIRQIDDFLAANGRRLIGWDEIAEGGLAENAAVMWWRGHGKKGLSIAMNAAEKGHDIVVASTSHLYFDYYQSKDITNEPPAIGNFLPLEKVYAFEPIIDGLSEQAAAHVLGAQGQLWTEYMPDMKQVEYMAFPRACALAELVWLPKGRKDYASFLERMTVQEQRFDAAKVKYRKTDP